LARLADLTILPHPDRIEDENASDMLHAVLFESGRPVLIVPRTAPATIGSRCCIAWNGTVESASALTAALPWLARAEAVRVLHAGAYQRRGPHAADVLSYLALHGIIADAAEFEPVSRDVGAGLLQAAAAFDANLLAMGAYSHSRLRQLILGGVTRHVLANAALPLLMAR
jgi:nucleotide-binding universal stress UspA family protein